MKNWQKHKLTARHQTSEILVVIWE